MDSRFEFLQDFDKSLSRNMGYAENSLKIGNYQDVGTKSRTLIETLLRSIDKHYPGEAPKGESLFLKTKRLQKKGCFPPHIKNLVHRVREDGNEDSHAFDTKTEEEARRLLENALTIAKWFMASQYAGNPAQKRSAEDDGSNVINANFGNRAKSGESRNPWENPAEPREKAADTRKPDPKDPPEYYEPPINKRPSPTPREWAYIVGGIFVAMLFVNSIGRSSNGAPAPPRPIQTVVQYVPQPVYTPTHKPEPTYAPAPVYTPSPAPVYSPPPDTTVPISITPPLGYDDPLPVLSVTQPGSMFTVAPNQRYRLEIPFGYTFLAIMGGRVNVWDSSGKMLASNEGSGLHLNHPAGAPDLLITSSDGMAASFMVRQTNGSVMPDYTAQAPEIVTPPIAIPDTPIVIPPIRIPLKPGKVPKGGGYHDPRYH